MEIITALEKLSTELETHQKDEIRKELSAYLNQLLVNDFSALVQLLYRLDVSEQKLKQVLKENTEADAGDLLAELIIERQLQKKRTVQAFPRIKDISDEDQW